MNIQFGGRNKFRAVARTLAVTVAVLLISAGIVRAPVARADSLLDFTGTTVSGAPFNGASLKGKPVVLWFWAAYCPFCNGEGPHVSAVSAANPRVTFVGIFALLAIPTAAAHITGSFNLTGVTDGEHHLILSFDDIGLTVVAAVTVQRNELAATGGELSPALWVGAALFVLGAGALIGSSLRTRRRTRV